MTFPHSRSASLVALLTVTGALALAGTAMAGMTFQRTDIAVGSQPSAVAAGDLNGDGRSDIVVANRGSDSVTVLLAQAGGGFAQAAGSPIAVGDQPVALDLGDFDAGATKDLAVANAGTGVANGTISTFLGNGDGTFTASAGSPWTVGHDPSAVTAAQRSGGGGPVDLNGDGNGDLVVANRADDTVTVLWGNGSGRFDFAPPTVLPSLGDAPADAEVDFGACGGSSIWTANAGDGTIGYLPAGCGGGGTPNGTFPGGERFTVAAGSTPQALAFLSDKLPGVSRTFLAIARSAANDARLLEMQFTLPQGQPELGGSPFAAGAAPWALATGAFTGNAPEGSSLNDPMTGWPTDLAIADRDSDELTFLLGDTRGTFRRAVGTFTVGDQPVGVATGLFGGSPPNDVVTANAGADTVSVLRNTSVATMSPAPSSVTFADQVAGTVSGERAVALKNTGGRPLDVASVTLAGANPADFVLSHDGCSAHRLPGGVDATCLVLVRYAPATTGASGATLLVTDTAAGSPHQVALSGTAITASALIGPQGAAGAAGATGPAGTPASSLPAKLVLVAYQTTVSAKAVSVRYALTTAASVWLVVKPRTGKSAIVTRVTGRPGLNQIRWNRRLAGRRAKAGRYQLQLVASANGQIVTRRLSVRIR